MGMPSTNSIPVTTKSQSLPNQVNDFNLLDPATKKVGLSMSQSLPNQVNDFNVMFGSLL